MCRSVCEGGRRCPSNRGERERSYRRGRYAAKKVSDERSLSATAVLVREPQDPSPENGWQAPKVSDQLPSHTDLAAMTSEQRAQVIEAARERYDEAARVAADALENMESAPRDSEAAPAAERAYVESLQNLGTAVSTAVEARFLDAVGSDTGESVDEETMMEAIRSTKTRFPEAVMEYRKLHMAHQSGDKERFLQAQTDFLDKTRSGMAVPKSAVNKTLHKVMEKAELAYLDQEAQVRREIMRDELGRFGSFGGLSPETTFTRLSAADRKNYDEALSMYPDALIEEAWEKGPPLEVKKTSSRAHYGSRVSLGAVDGAMRYHHPFGAGEITAEKLGSKATTMVRSGLSTYHDEITTTPDLIPLLGKASYTRFRSVSKMFLEDTPTNRMAMERFAKAYNETKNKSRDIEVVTVTYPGGEERIGLADAGGPFNTPHRSRAIAKITGEITTDGTISDSVHEMAHRIESDNDRIGRACKRFHADRTEGLKRRMYARGEHTYEDSFVNSYVGKVYLSDPNATEIFSVGMESMCTGKYGALTGRPDPTRPDDEHIADTEHRDLVIGLLANLATKR